MDLVDLAWSQARAGMRRATEHAESDSPGWSSQALAYLESYAKAHDRFPGWFVTHEASLQNAVPKASGKAWGSIFTKAARLGWIEKDGYTTDPNRNCNPVPVWRSLIYRRAA